MIRPIYVFIICVILMYVVTRFRAMDERLNIMRRSLDSRVTDADVGNMIQMVRDHLGADMETRVEELSARIDLIEEKLPRVSLDCKKNIFENSSHTEEGPSPQPEDQPASIVVAEVEEDEEAPPDDDE